MSNCADAFLRQAEEDFRALMSMDQCEAPSTCCMLMQMVFEKLAKAKLAKDNGEWPPKIHDINHYLLKRLTSREPNKKQKYLPDGKIMEFALSLEDAQPSAAKDCMPQLEYPWKDGVGIVYCPADDLFLAKRIINPCDRIRVEVINYFRRFFK